MDNRAKKVLIIEDEKPLAQAMMLKLTHEGFLVTVACDGSEGLRLLNEERYDLVLLDLVMPKVNGFEVLAQIKKSNNPTKVIVISNLRQQEDLKKAQELGADKYLLKLETSVLDLVNIVRNTINENVK